MMGLMTGCLSNAFNHDLTMFLCSMESSAKSAESGAGAGIMIMILGC